MTTQAILEFGLVEWATHDAWQRVTHISVGGRRAKEVDKILPLHSIGAFLDGLEEERQKRVRSVRLVSVEVAQDREGYHPLQQGQCHDAPKFPISHHMLARISFTYNEPMLLPRAADRLQYSARGVEQYDSDCCSCPK